MSSHRSARVLGPFALGVGVAALLNAPLAARAQSAPSPSAAPSAAPFVLRLTPPTPEGGVYGGAQPSAPAPAQPSAPAPAQPSAVAPVAPSAEAPANTPPPPVAPAQPIAPWNAPSAPPSEQPAPAPAPLPSGRLLQPVAAEAQPGSLGAPPAALDPTRVARASLLQARLRLLNSALPGLSARSSSARVLDSVLHLVTGGGVLALSFAVPSGAGQDLRPWFWTQGGSELLLGAAGLLWVPARERLAAQFEAMPMGTARQRRLRVQFGEQALEDMAADGARRRVVFGLGRTLLSVAPVLIAYRDPLFNGTPYTFSGYDALIIGLTSISVITGLLEVFQRSEEERLRDTYRTQLRILQQERGL